MTTDETQQRHLDLNAVVAAHVEANGFDRASLIDKVDKALIAIALVETRGNQFQAAKLIGINRGSLRKYRERKLEPKQVQV